MHRLQNITEPSVFNPRAFYDGKKNLFSAGPLKMNGDAAEVRILRFVEESWSITHAGSLAWNI